MSSPNKITRHTPTHHTRTPNTRTPSTAGLDTEILGTSSKRAAFTFIIAILLTSTLVSGTFLLTGQPIPDWFVISGRWIPALVAFAVIVAFKLDGGVLAWSQIKPRGFKNTLFGSLAAIGSLVATYVGCAYVYSSAAWLDMHSVAFIVEIMLWTLPLVLVFMFSTIGEELAWRGFLQKALSDWGYWRASATISLVWMLFHLPLHGTMVVQGVLGVDAAIATTLSLFGLGMFLSGLTIRFDSVWPAAIAHAAPLSVLNLVNDVDSLPAAHLYGITALTSVVLIVVGAVFARAGTLERS